MALLTTAKDDGENSALPLGQVPAAPGQRGPDAAFRATSWAPQTVNTGGLQ